LMKKKVSKILGVGLAFVLVASLLVFAIPVAAEEFAPTANTWKGYEPDAGAAGGWFFDPAITRVGPIAEAINGDLFAYVEDATGVSTNAIFKSTDGGRTWTTSTAPGKYAGGRVVDMVCSSLYEDVLYVTDGNYVYKSIDGGVNFAIVAKENLEFHLMGECGIPIVDEPITCLDVGYNGADAPVLFIGTRNAGHYYPFGHALEFQAIVGTVLWITEESFPAQWYDLQLMCYGCCDINTLTTGVTGEVIGTGNGSLLTFADTLGDVPVEPGSVVVTFDSDVTGESIGTGDGTLVTFASTLGSTPIVPGSVVVTDTSTSETFTDNGDGTLTGGGGGSGTINYATGAISVTFALAPANLDDIYAGYTYSETFADNGDGTLTGSGGGTGTIDYDTGAISVTCVSAPASGDFVTADYDYYYNGGDGCFDVYAVGAAADFNLTDKVYVLVTTDDLDCDGSSGDDATRVLSTVGTTCSWSFVAELFWDCNPGNPFTINHASRFAFPTDFTDTKTMFIGVSTDPHNGGGDVYRVVDAPTIAIDLNVQGFSTGCVGIHHANICSLDMYGSTDDGSLIAGAYDGWETQQPTNVYYSNDGGWTWSASKKDPTGRGLVYVLWHGDSAVAGTAYCDCGFSMSCGDEVGEYWNQISLIDTDITRVLDLSHAPGYVDGASTMFMLTECDTCCGKGTTDSLFRWDGTYWERVYSSQFCYWMTPHWGWSDLMMDWVEVSPDFGTTNCVYLANSGFEMLRSIDAGCSWAPLSYPCDPRPTITAWIVVDEETVLASSCSTTTIWKTTRHGTRPWSSFPIATACCGVDFDLSPSIATDDSVLFGDRCGKVYISEDVGSTWDMVADAVAPIFGSRDYTYVQFDPGYGTSGDPGVNMIYAAAGTIIGRCDIDPDALWNKQDWVAIYSGLCYASGIDAAGDTALYVSDSGTRGEGIDRLVTIDGSMEVVCLDCDDCEPGDIGGYMLPPLGPVVVTEISGAFLPGELVEIISYDLECFCEQYEGYIDECICQVWGYLGLRGITSGATGSAYIDVVYYSEASDTEPGDCYGVTQVISSFLTATVTGAADTSCPTGVYRSLNPMALVTPSLNLVEFEFLTTGLLSTTSLWHPMGSDDLWLTTRGMSNVLWCLDSGNPTYVWVWDDPLANPVILGSPTCGTQLTSTSGVTLEWEALDGASAYEINLYQYCPQCPDEKLKITVPNSTDTCAIISGLNAGTLYYWQVRVASGHPYLSKWSELCEFTTALGAIPNLCSPVCGGDDILLNTNFSWDKVGGAASYELQIVAASADGTADFTGAATLTTDVNALASIPGLAYSTTYYWRVRAVTASIPGAWSVCIFTTLDEPEEPVPPADLIVNIPADEVVTPIWLWVLIGIGAALTIAVVVLIVTTRRVP